MSEEKTLQLILSTDMMELSLRRRHESDVAWPALLQDFVTFLEGAGYVGVSEKVVIKSDRLFGLEDWYGKVIADEECE